MVIYIVIGFSCETELPLRHILKALLHEAICSCVTTASQVVSFKKNGLLYSVTLLVCKMITLLVTQQLAYI